MGIQTPLTFDENLNRLFKRPHGTSNSFNFITNTNFIAGSGKCIICTYTNNINVILLQSYCLIVLSQYLVCRIRFLYRLNILHTPGNMFLSIKSNYKIYIYFIIIEIKYFYIEQMNSA